jgi:cellulose synthase/poly-beta-1,6-N-acetylglucosamine synthase-like glycosyltransferase
VDSVLIAADGAVLALIVLAILVALRFRLSECLDATVNQFEAVFPVGVVYICSDDVDPQTEEALLRILSLDQTTLVVCDDSLWDSSKAFIDSLCSRLNQRYGCRVTLLRSATGRRGKVPILSEALNVLHAFEFILLLDSDGGLLDTRGLTHAANIMRAEPSVGIIQFATQCLPRPNSSLGERLACIGTSSLMVAQQEFDRNGWQPFIGHNALLRHSAIRDVRGFRQSLAEDLDISLRMAAHRWKIRFLYDIFMRERVPPSYESFRHRLTKMSAGSVAALRMGARMSLFDGSLSVKQRIAFWSFVSFYPLQAAFHGTLLGLIIVMSLTSQKLLVHFVVLYVGSIIWLAIPMIRFAFATRQLKDNAFGIIASSLLYTLPMGCRFEGIIIGVLRPNWFGAPSNIRRNGSHNTTSTFVIAIVLLLCMTTPSHVVFCFLLLSLPMLLGPLISGIYSCK